MGIFSKGEKKYKCDKNLDDGSIECERYKENPDGTKVTLAEVKVVVDGMCTKTLVHEEGSPEELKELKKDILGDINATCKKNPNQKPGDY